MLRLIRKSTGNDPFAGYIFDQDQSDLTAMVMVADPDLLLWLVHLEWTNANEKEPAFRLISAEISELDFQETNWRQLGGKETRRSFKAWPVLPDNPANFYSFGGHAIPIENHVCILNRAGNYFTRQWTFLIDGLMQGEAIEATESVAFEEFLVGFEDATSVDVELAKRIARRFFEPEELGEANVALQWVRFSKKA
jgi:hypothetical protein